MGTECQLPRSEEDRRMIDEAIERSKIPNDLSPETYAEVMPEVEKAIAQRCVECLEENAERARDELVERLEQKEELTALERIDLETRPTEKEYQEMYKIGKEIGMEDWEIINAPGICGTEEVEDVPDKIREVMTTLYTSKIPPEYWQAGVVDKIMFVGAEAAKNMGLTTEEGYVLKDEILDQKKELPKTVHLILGERDELLIEVDETKGEIPEGKGLLWGLAHEIYHLNVRPITDVVNDHNLEWTLAQASQGKVSDYSLVNGQKNQEEYRAECFAAWVVDSPDLCTEMKEFFQKHFS